MLKVLLRLSGAFLVALLSAGNVFAQDAELPELDDLKAPTSPAFVILDAAPSKVERPQAVKPLVLSALSAAGEGFPKNYAVEFSPYWLGTPRLTFDDYYRNDVAKDSLRHLSLSVATTPLGKTPELGTALAMGVRTLPFPGSAHPSLAALRGRLAPLQKTLLNLQSIDNKPAQSIKLLREALAVSVRGDSELLSKSPFDELVKEALDIFINDIQRRKTLIAGLQKELDDGTLSDAERAKNTAEIEKLEKELATAEATGTQEQAAKMLEAFRSSTLPSRLSVEQALGSLVTRLEEQQKAAIARTEAQLKATALAIQALDTKRVGFLLAVAGAVAWDVPADATSETRLSKLGVWLTPGYRIVRCNDAGECSRPFDLLTVFRYLDNRRGDEESTWELGTRLVWQAAEKLAVSGEWLARTSGDDSADRAVGVAEYEITKSTFLYASFGRDFEEKGTRRNLVSLIGITFGFGNKPILTTSE
jgi:hypothetical protein